MKINQIVALGVLCVGFVAFTGCKKEEGPMGPQGPIGPQGSTGQEGNAGQDGNANVQTQNLIAYWMDWSGTGLFYNTYLKCNIITADIAANGAVMCYMKSGNYYTPMPISMDMLTYTLIGFEHSIGSINIFFQGEDISTPDPGLRQFKVVAIASSGIEANPNLDLQNYEAVKQAFKLED